MLSSTLINSHSQVSNPGPEGPFAQYFLSRQGPSIDI